MFKVGRTYTKKGNQGGFWVVGIPEETETFVILSTMRIEDLAVGQLSLTEEIRVNCEDYSKWELHVE